MQEATANQAGQPAPLVPQEATANQTSQPVPFVMQGRTIPRRAAAHQQLAFAARQADSIQRRVQKMRMLVSSAPLVNSALLMGPKVAAYALPVAIVGKDQPLLNNVLKAVDVLKARPNRALAKCSNTSQLSINPLACHAHMLLNLNLAPKFAYRSR
jgi:hypothetical protein